MVRHRAKGSRRRANTRSQRDVGLGRRRLVAQAKAKGSRHERTAKRHLADGNVAYARHELKDAARAYRRAARLYDENGNTGLAAYYRKLADRAGRFIDSVSAARDPEKKWGVFPHAEWVVTDRRTGAGHARETGGGFVVREMSAAVPYSRMKPVRVFSRKSAADKLSDKLTYG